MSEKTTQAWVDRHHDVWVAGEDGLLHTPETAAFPREYVEKKWGPLRPTTIEPYTPLDHEIRVGALNGRSPLIRRRELGITLAKADQIAGEEYDRWLAAHDREVAAKAKAAGVMEAVKAIDRVYQIQCPVISDRYYLPGAGIAHRWWERVLGGALSDLQSRADRIERGERVE